MGRWIRVDVTRQQHPRACHAGFWGGVVAEACWEVCKAHDRPGVLPTIFWSPDFLARWTHADAERGGLAGIKRGMEAAVAAGLVEVLPDGAVRIHDWEQYQLEVRKAGKRIRTTMHSEELRDPDPGSSRIIPDHPGSSRTIPLTGQDRTEDGERTPDDRDRADRVDPTSLKWAIWGEYVKRFEDKEGTYPAKSQLYRDRDLDLLIRAAQAPARIKGFEVDNAEVLSLATDIMDRFFASDEIAIVGQGPRRYSLGVLVQSFGELLQRKRRERRAV